MRSEPEQEQEAFRPKPLPSVNIALLPHELRAARMQRWFLFGAIAVALIGGAAAAFGPALLSRFGRRSETAATALTVATSGAALGTPSDPAAATTAPKLDTPSTAPLAAEAAPIGTPIQPSATPAPLPTPAAAVARDEPSPAPSPSPAVANTVTTTTTPDNDLRTERKVGTARSFRDALLKAGTSPAEAAELTFALQKLVDFRRVKPEQTLMIERDPEHALRIFEYRAGLTEVYRAKRGENGKLRGERVQIPIEKRRIAKGTQISGSLGQSLAALGLGPALAGAVIEAFDAKISFKKDTRAGDSVKLIVDEEYVDGQFLRYGNVLAVEYAGEKAGKQQAFWFDDDHGGDFFDPNGRAMHGGWLRTPLRYDHISSGYNLRRRHPILKRIMPHQGIDYSAGTGTPVWAAAEGSVTFAGARGPNGNLVSIKHGNGYESHYAHLWRIAAGVRVGAHVKQRQVIGYVGTTGRSTGPHLHFALKKNGNFLDPATQLNGPGLPLPAAAMPRFRAIAQRLRAELDRIPLAPPTVTGVVTPEHDDDSNAEEEIDL